MCIVTYDVIALPNEANIDLEFPDLHGFFLNFYTFYICFL